VKLLREQAQRCRDILSKIAELPAGEPFDRVPLPALIEEAVAPHRHFDVSIEVKLPSDQPDMPAGARNPAIRYGLGNLIENAVDFAHKRVEILAQWTATEVRLTISDDGPGFAPEILDRIGAPYVTHRRTGPRPTGADEDEYEGGFGLGLGFFIAKTLLERSGATLSLKNQMPPLHGATVTIVWNRADFERVAVAPPLEPATVVS
jgi:two-component system sensor histidine kinase RegB